MDYNSSTGRKPSRVRRHEKTQARLHEVIARLYEGMAEVEVRSEALAGFAQPVPDYDLQQLTLRIPNKQAVALAQSQPCVDGKASSGYKVHEFHEAENCSGSRSN